MKPMEHNADCLSAEAFDDLLIGLGTADAAAHAADCPLCSAHLNNFQQDLQLFQTTTLSWSEARADALEPLTEAATTADLSGTAAHLSQTTAHLSEEALNDALIGMSTAATEAHLAGCASCSAQIESFQADVVLFNTTTLGWSEGRQQLAAAAHLSEEALNDALIGMSTAATEAHLADCESCRARVDGFQFDLALGAQTSLDWSRQRAAAMDTHVVPVPRLRLERLAFGSSLAALLLVAAATPLLWHHDRRVNTTAQPEQATAVQPEESESKIAEDNALLAAVDAAVNPAEDSPLSELRFTSTPNPREKARPE